MKYKYVLKNKETQQSKDYKSYVEIASDLNLDVYQVKAIHNHILKPRKNYHAFMSKLLEKYEINYHPDYLVIV